MEDVVGSYGPPVTDRQSESPNRGQGDRAILCDKDRDRGHEDGAILGDENRERGQGDGAVLCDKDRDRGHEDGAILGDENRERGQGDGAVLCDKDRDRGREDGAILCDGSKEKGSGSLDFLYSQDGLSERGEEGEATSQEDNVKDKAIVNGEDMADETNVSGEIISEEAVKENDLKEENVSEEDVENDRPASVREGNAEREETVNDIHKNKREETIEQGTRGAPTLNNSLFESLESKPDSAEARLTCESGGKNLIDAKTSDQQGSAEHDKTSVSNDDEKESFDTMKYNSVSASVELNEKTVTVEKSESSPVEGDENEPEASPLRSTDSREESAGVGGGVDAIATPPEQERDTDRGCVELNGEVERNEANPEYEIDHGTKTLSNEVHVSPSNENDEVEFESASVEGSGDSPDPRSIEDSVTNDLNEDSELKSAEEIEASSVHKRITEDATGVEFERMSTVLTKPDGLPETCQGYEALAIVKDILNSVLERLESSEKVESTDAVKCLDKGNRQSAGTDSGETKSDFQQDASIDAGKKTIPSKLVSLHKDVDVIHVLSDEEEQTAKPDPVIITNEDEDILKCSVTFSDVQSNFKRHLDEEGTGPAPKVFRPDSNTAKQQNKKVCYGDGTYCVECGKTFSLQAYFSDHISSHFLGALSALGQCALCGLVFTNSLVMTVHLVSAQERMEAAMKLMSQNGSLRKKKRDLGSLSSTADEDSKRIPSSGGSNTSLSSGVETTEQSQSLSPEKRISPDRELPTGSKRRRKAPEKFVSDPSPTIVRRRNRGSSGSGDNADPEVEAYLQGLMKQGLTVDPAALGVPQSSSPSSSKNNKTGARSGHAPKNKAYANNSNAPKNNAYTNNNGKVHYMSSKTALGALGLSAGGFLTWSGQRGRGGNKVNPIRSPLIPSKPSVISTLPYNHNVCFMPGSGPGNRFRFPHFPNTGVASKQAVSTLPAQKRPAIKPPVAGHQGVVSKVVTGAPTVHTNKYVHNYIPNASSLPFRPQPELSRKAHFVLRTTLAASPLIKDPRIEKLRRRRISRRETRGCKRVRNVRVRMRRLAMPPPSEGKWPVWRLNPGSSQTPNSPHGGRHRGNTGLQRLHHHPEVSRLIQHPQQGGQGNRGKSLGLNVGSLCHTVPAVKLNKVSNNPSKVLKNPTTTLVRPQLPSFSSCPPAMPMNTAKSVNRTKEESRNVVEMMLQSLATPGVDFQGGEKNSVGILSPTNLSTGTGFSKGIEMSRPPTVQRIVAPTAKRAGPSATAPASRAVLVPSKPKPLSNDIIVIDDEEEDVSGNSSRGKQAGEVSSTTQKNQKLLSPRTKISQLSSAKNVVEVREITSAEPSVIVDMTSTQCSPAHRVRKETDMSAVLSGSKDSCRVSEKKGGGALKEGQDFFSWKSCVAESPESEDEDEEKSAVPSDCPKTKPGTSDKKAADQRSACSKDGDEIIHYELGPGEGENSADSTSPSESISMDADNHKPDTSESEATETGSVKNTVMSSPSSSDSQLSRSVSHNEGVSIPAHLEDSSNIQDIFTEIEKTCREMQENSGDVPEFSV